MVINHPTELETLTDLIQQLVHSNSLTQLHDPFSIGGSHNNQRPAPKQQYWYL